MGCEKTAEWHNWEKSQGNSHQQTRNQLGTPRGANTFVMEAQILHRKHLQEQWLSIPYVQHIFSGEEKVSPGGQSPPLSYGPGHQIIRYADITF